MTVSQENKEKQGIHMVIVAPLVTIHFFIYPIFVFELGADKIFVWPSI